VRLVQGRKEEDSIFSGPRDVEGLGSSVFSSIATVDIGVIEAESSAFEPAAGSSKGKGSIVFSSSLNSDSSSEKFSMGE